MLSAFRVAVMLVLAIFWKPSFAQITYDGCVDFRGVPVASIANASIQDVAMATYAANGAPLIIYNPYVLAGLSHATRLFFYAHECGHHALGHGVRGHPLVREQEADCWAVQQLVARGLFGDEEIKAVQWDIARFGRGDWTHLPGPARALNLRACLVERQGTAPDPPDDPFDACHDRCQAAEKRCTARCDERSASGSCHDRCERRFDRCTNRCE